MVHRSVAFWLAALLALAVSCSSNNKAVVPATTAATSASQAVPSATQATAAPATSAAAASSPAAAIAQSPAAGAVAGVVPITFQPPGGSADWAGKAGGCHGVKAPANAEAAKASDTGITPTEIKLGTTQPLSGPASSYAPIIKTILACFAQVNDEGGVYGRKITMLVNDDQYVPANTKPLVQKMVEQDKVFAIASLLGTPTNSTVFDYLNDNSVPHMWILSGASKWAADPKSHPWSIGWQPDYITEGQNYAKYIQTNLKGKKVGILYQNDDYGKDYVIGLKKVLGDKGTADNPIVDEEIYESANPDVTGQVTNLKNKGVDVFVLIAIPIPSGNAIKAAATLGWHPTIILNSVAIDPTLNDLAGGKQNLEGVVSDTYYHQFDDPDPAVQEVKDFLAKREPTLQFANFPIYGYMIAQTYIETLKRAGVNLTRKSVIQAEESFKDWVIPQLLPGILFNTSVTNHAPLKCVKLEKAHDGVFQQFGDALCADK